MRIADICRDRFTKQYFEWSRGKMDILRIGSWAKGGDREVRAVQNQSSPLIAFIFVCGFLSLLSPNSVVAETTDTVNKVLPPAFQSPITWNAVDATNFAHNYPTPLEACTKALHAFWPDLEVRAVFVNENTYSCQRLTDYLGWKYDGFAAQRFAYCPEIYFFIGGYYTSMFCGSLPVGCSTYCYPSNNLLACPTPLIRPNIPYTDNHDTTCSRTYSSNTPEPAKNAAQLCAKTRALVKVANQQEACTNPINSGTGNKYQHEVDYAGAGLFPLRAERTYNSGGTMPSAIEATVWGSQWRGTYDRSISFVTSGGVSVATVKRSDGNQYYFNLTNGAWVGDADVVGTLVRLTDAVGTVTGWTYTNENDEIEAYNASGKLISITNKAGLTQTLTHSDGTAGANGGYVLDAAGVPTATVLPAGRLIRVTDPASRTLQFGYDAAGRVVKMTDPAGGVYIYAYSVTANLTSVTYPDDAIPGGNIRTYLYENTSYTHALTGITDENGARYASWAYDAVGRANSSEHGPFGSGIDHVGLVYTAPDANGNSTTSTTDATGVTRTYTFSTLLGVVKNTGITGQPCNGCSESFIYDANGNVESRADFNGNKTCYAYNTRNLETERLEGLPAGAACPASLSGYAPSTAIDSVERKTTTQWHASLRLPTTVAEPLRTTTYAYNGDGGITCGMNGTTPVPGVLCNKTIQPTGDATGGAGLSAAAAGTPRIFAYTYNAAGQVLTIDGPRPDSDVIDATQYEYDALGNLRKVIQPVTGGINHITLLDDYDANGRALKITDPNGLITNLTYDSRGRLTERNVGGESTRYIYDGVGQLKTVTMPGETSATYSYTYDAAHRLTDIADNLDNRIHYTLDNAGNREKEEIKDSANNTVQTHSRVFDALNRLWKDIAAINTTQTGTTTYEYYSNGNLKNITDPSDQVTTNFYDALNRLKEVKDPDPGIIKYEYDGLDQLIKVTDPRNLVTQYNRDGLGNLNQQTSPDTGTGTSPNTYDAAGNVKTSTDARGKLTSYEYDALNRLTKITYADGKIVDYGYDQGPSANAIGQLTNITDPSGQTAWLYDAHGRVKQKTQTIGAKTFTLLYNYDPTHGWLTQITYPSGRIIVYGYDAARRVNSITVGTADSQPLLNTVLYQPFGPPASWSWGNGSAYSRSFYLDGRIKEFPLGTNKRTLTYDLAGRIHGFSDSVPTPPSFPNIHAALNVSASSNRLVSQTGSSPRTYTYDAAGNLESDGTNTYTFDAGGRLMQATAGGVSIQYKINGLGQRVEKIGGSASGGRYFVYDGAGHLLGEYDANASPVQETIWLGDTPVGVVKPSGLFYVFADQIGTPRVVTTSAPTPRTVWSWASDTYGNGAPVESPDDGGVNFKYNLRFPGQYFDQETGLHYNVNRDYDPATGRYIESDPIGLMGGINTYTYVGGNPISFTDPLGLIRYNAPAPRTVPVQGTTAQALQCVEQCLQRATNNPDLNVLVTGGAEQNRHSRDSHHDRGEACDIAGPRHNPVNNNDVMNCASECGFGAGQYETFRNNPNRDHWHLQMTPGNGVPAIPAAQPPTQ